MKYTKKDLTQSINRLNDLTNDIMKYCDRLAHNHDKKDLIKFEIMKYLYDYENEIRLINNELSKDFGMGYDPKLKNDEAFIDEKIDKLIDYGKKIYKGVK
tara:strand:- start:3645 stop:3944 length:300 start_codon:yes stop_codon:yes gene_type:complete